MKRVVILILGLSMLCTFAFAKLYSAPPAFQGTSTVGPGGDYPDFTTAAADFNTTAPTGNWTLEITGNFSQPLNVAFGQTTGAFTFTIKPQAAAQPVVTFTDTADNIGWSGGLLIGVNSAGLLALDNGFRQTTTVIDGSNNGTTSQDLTFVFPANFSVDIKSLSGPPVVAGGYPVGIHVVGSDNCILKNFKVQFLVDNALNHCPATRSVYGVRVGSRRTSATGDPANTDMIPDNTLLKNLNIWAVGARQAHGVGATTSGTMAGVQKAQRGMIIEDSIITGQTRGILLNANSSFTLRNNILRCQQNDPAGGLGSTGFIHASSNGDVAQTANVYNNVFDNTYSAATVAGGGIIGIQLSGAPAATGSKYVVWNNVFRRFTLTCGVSTDLVYRGIETGSSYSQMEIYNNNLIMDPIPNVSGVTLNRCAAIVATSTNTNNNFILKNNIITFDQAGLLARCIVKANTVAPTSDNNNWKSPRTAAGNFARIGATEYAYAAWQALPKDAASITNDPIPVLAGDRIHFIHYAAYAPWKIGATGGAIPAVDFDGDAQPAAPIWIGTDVPGGTGASYLWVNSANSNAFSPDPVPGYNYAKIGNSYTIGAIDITPSAGTKYVCTGWAGSGDAELTGSGSNTSITYQHDAASTITWSWKTQYQITTAVAPGGAPGTVTPATGTWYDSGANPSCSWSGPAKYVFNNWTGDLTSSNNPDTTLIMNAPKSITANIVWPVYQAISTSPHDFGNRAIGSGNYDFEFIIKNNGTSQLSITAFTPSGSTDFSMQETPTINVAAGTTTGLTLRYTPVTLGSQTGNFTCVSNDPAGDPVISGTGVGQTSEVIDWALIRR